MIQRLPMVLDTPFAVPLYAMRPPCDKCKEKVTGHSFWHGPNGVICDACRGLVKRAVQLEAYRMLLKASRNVVRPTHPCADCGRDVADYRSKHCRTCAAKVREAAKTEGIARVETVV